ncbi:MAG: alanine--glyoxylate aminotransferase family protein [Clostridia bacterium]|nr:alanine--glyoxylate aminotransferase family protein [Clostridia bacterium]
MEREKLLMTPGPTMVPTRVLQAMSKQIIHHRTKEFSEIFKNLSQNIKKVFHTENPVITLASSGTGAMESSIVNLFNPGDKILVASIGVFGDRYATIAERFGLKVDNLKITWGECVDPQLIKEKLEQNKDDQYRGVIVTHNETSTGVVNDVEEIGSILKQYEEVLFIVDAVSSMGGAKILTDEWGIDVVVTGSQKALMTPPGLAFASVSKKAMEAVEKSTLPKYYWDYKDAVNRLGKENPDTPYTPAVSLIIGANVAVNMLLEEGLENIYQRHNKLALATREAVKALGLELVTKEECASPLITSIKAPEGVDIEEVRKIMNVKYDIMIAGGQKHLKGKIFRIGHMGYVDKFDLMRTIAALEYSLLEKGYNMELGQGLAAAQKILV